MKNILKRLIPVALLAPGLSFALGLGEVEVYSKLNEPLNAEIRLLYSDPQEPAETTVTLASEEDFRRVGLDATMVPVNLDFEVTLGVEGDYVIKITSQQSVTEPFLDILIDVNWANGRVLREYVMLLDPPVIAPSSNQAQTTGLDSTTQTAPVSTSEEPEYVPVEDEPEPVESAPSTTEDTSAAVEDDYEPLTPSNVSDGTYGPVAAGDTLWEIAQASRPSSDISVNRMMVMLLQMNPDAFYDNNINALKRGAILRLPTESEFDSVSEDDAVAEVNTQNRNWESYRDTQSSRPTSVSDAGISAEYDDDPEPVSVASDDSRLAIVPPAGDARSEVDRPGSSDSAVDASLADARAELIRTQEELITAEQDNDELRSRVNELESLIDKYESNLSLRDAEMADLQEQLRQARLDASSTDSSVGDDFDDSEFTDSQYSDPLADSGEDDAVSDADLLADSGYDTDTGFDTSDDADAYDPYALEDTDDTTYDDGLDTGEDAFDTGETISDDTSDADQGSSVGEDELDALLAEQAAAGAAQTNAQGQESSGQDASVETDSSGGDAWYMNPIVWGGAGLLVLLGIGAVVVAKRRSNDDGEATIFDDLDDEGDVDTGRHEAITDEQVAVGVSEDDLRAAVEQNPTDPQAHLALIRRYYADDDKEKFVAQSESMLEHIGGETHPAWMEVRSMGGKLAPEHAMFGGTAVAAADDEEVEFDLDSDLDAELDTDLDEEVSAPSSADVEPPSSEDLAVDSSDDDFDLDLDFGDDADDDDDADIDLDLDGDDDLDLDLDLGDDADGKKDEDDLDVDLDLDGDDDLDLDLDFGDDADSSDAADSNLATSTEEDTEFELQAVSDDDDDDLDLGDLDLDDNSAGDDDSVGTKLDLAKAYVDMGDPDGARGMLEEVMAEGNDEQKAEAKALLADLND